jgi:hypothetical protein
MRSVKLWFVLFGLLAMLAGYVPATETTAQATAVDKGLAQDIKEIVLDNGLRIFVLERTTSPTFAAAYRFGVGGAMDPRGRSGIAHLLEHMMFKGTSNIGTSDAEKEAELMDLLNQLWHELHQELDRQDDPFQEADEERISKLKEEMAPHNLANPSKMA